MTASRREFIRRLGIALGSLMVTRCTSAGRGGVAALGRERVRRCWASLDELSERTKRDPGNSQEARDSLSFDHRAALDDLVAVGELEAPVAAQVQAAFEEAAYHVWRTYAATCYEPVAAPLHRATVRGDLMVQQRTLLEEAEDLDPETVARAQSAIARDITVLGIWRAEGAVDERIATLWKSGEYSASAEDIEAARFLVELLLEP